MYHTAFPNRESGTGVGVRRCFLTQQCGHSSRINMPTPCGNSRPRCPPIACTISETILGRIQGLRPCNKIVFCLVVQVLQQEITAPYSYPVATEPSRIGVRVGNATSTQLHRNTRPIVESWWTKCTRVLARRSAPTVTEASHAQDFHAFPRFAPYLFHNVSAGRLRRGGGGGGFAATSLCNPVEVVYISSLLK